MLPIRINKKHLTKVRFLQEKNMKIPYLPFLTVSICLLIALLTGCKSNSATQISSFDDTANVRQYTGNISNSGKYIFSFDITADMRQYTDGKYLTPEYFKGVCLAIAKTGKGAFMVSPGDIDPPEPVYNIVNNVLGPDYPWYPVVGNHESETPDDMRWLRKYGEEKLLDHVNPGPQNCRETTYSFDYKNSHMVVINEYYDGKSDTGTNGDISDALYNWIKDDLNKNKKPFIFVFGHEPFVSLPDVDNGRHRHKGDNLDDHPKNSHRFAQLLRQRRVTAYINGHTHNFSYAKINGIWQIDAGHARGIADSGAPSTFLKVYVGSNNSWIEAYRLNQNKTYIKTDKITLN
jgi:predicted phosphodiesterase